MLITSTRRDVTGDVQGQISTGITYISGTYIMSYIPII